MKNILIPFLLFSSSLFSCEFCDDISREDVKRIYTEIFERNETLRSKIYEGDEQLEEFIFIIGKSQAYHECMYLLRELTD